MKKKKVRLPSGKVVIRKVEKKVGVARCAKCGKPLSGVPRERKKRLKRLAKTKKRPERPYGGYLCAACMREVFREKVRELKAE